ncbi:Na+/H+ antiporter [[Actinomadura] parvosata subsp. kistnae]|uniref:Cation transporter n=1 Tax=[Actinomadura] parvosata subsp. kistnae TaxID=1909395 RepID=A0A1U9ZT25_9ACTN|nr:cation:proton antiporter [Nonomuraea sp. ATCC 55076]AQZ61105.1 cation transporter [Nonomuraea sp. ATCC 55076]SPL87520.1 Na+/H+ antiporter [Actinomadura parvosata subsp. kistnae]
MSTLDLILALGGAAALLAAILPEFLARRALSLPLVYLLAGILLFTLPLGLPDPDPIAHRVALEHITELCVVISLMGAGLAINRRIGPRGWSTTWRLLALAMPLTVAGVAAAAVALPGWPIAAALLLGAVLAPTDPVLASDVHVGEPVDAQNADDEVRFALTSEAGLNDGLAFPIVYAAIAVAAGTAGWAGEWALTDVLYRTAAGALLGLLIGGLLGRLFFRARSDGLRLAERRDGFVALACTFLAYGVTELAHGYGFVAVFVTACAIRSAEHGHGYNNVLHGFVEQIERLLTAWLLLLLGGFVATGGLAALTWRGAAVGLLLLLVIRPLAGWLVQWRGRAGPRERLAISFFGIRGIGSLFYLAYALGQADFGVPAEELWAVTGFTVLASVVLHGVTATPVMNHVDALRKAHLGRGGR